MDIRKEPETVSSSSSHTPKLSLEFRHSISSHVETPFSPDTPGHEKSFPEAAEFYLGSLEYTQNFLRQYIDPPPGFGNKEKQESLIFTPEDSSAPDNRTNLDSLDDLASEADFGRESVHGGGDQDPKDLFQEYRKYKGFCRRLHARLLDVQQVTGLYYDQNTQLILDQINADSDCAPCTECERLKKLNEHLVEQLNGDHDSKHGDPLYCSRKEYNDAISLVARVTEENKGLLEQVEMEAGRNKELERRSEEGIGCRTQLIGEIETAKLQIEELQEYIRRADLANSVVVTELKKKYAEKKRKLKDEIANLHETYQRSLKSAEHRVRHLAEKVKELQPDASDLEDVPICTNCSQLQALNARLEDRIQSLEEYIKASKNRSLRDSASETRYRDLESRYLALEARLKDSLPGLKVVARSSAEVTETYERLAKYWKSGDNSEWNKEGGRLLQGLGTAIARSEQTQSVEFTQSGREIRQKVHQQVVRIEEMMNDLQATTPAVEPVREEYLQLPYLLKPLFDQLKSYERHFTTETSADQLETSLAQVKKEKTELESTLERKEAEIRDLRNIKVRCNTLETEIKQFEKSVQFYERKASILKRDNDSLRGKVTELQSTLVEMVQHIQKNKAMTSASMAELARYKEKLENYKQRVEEHKEREGQLQKELHQLREFADYQSHQAMIVNERAEELRQQNEELRLENDELKNSYEYKFN